MKRKETYRNVTSQDGSLTIHLMNPLANRVRGICQQRNISVMKFVEDCMNIQLDRVERESLESLTKEMLIELYLTEKNGK